VTVDAEVFKTIEVGVWSNRTTFSQSSVLTLATHVPLHGSLLQEGSVADVTVKLGLIKLLQKTFDVCEEA
jgi:hypothetical protein